MSTVKIDTSLDLKTLSRDLSAAEKQVNRLKEKLEKQKGQRSRLTEDAAELGARLDEAKAKLDELQNMSNSQKKNIFAGGGDPKQMIAEQAQTVAALQKEYDKADASVVKMDAHIADTEGEIDRANAKVEEQAALYKQAEDAAGTQATVMARVGKVVNGALDQITHRVKGLMKRVLFFSVITAALRSVRGYFSDVLSQNEEASQAIANMKNAFATLAQPLISAVIPAVVALANWVTRVVTAIIQLISLLTGKKLKDAQKTTGAKKGSGGGGGGNDKSLAGFDTLNQLSGGGGGGGGAAAEMQAVADLGELTNSEMAGILTTVGLIGAALAAWKLPFGGGLSFFEKFIGYLLIIIGFAIAARGYFDAWTKGVSWQNLITILGGVAIALGGLYILFGTVGVAIGLVVAGIAVLILAFKDIMTNGATLQNTVLMIIGTILTALGAFILTGNPFALIIGLIAAVVLAVVAAGGEMEGLINGIKTMFSGVIKFIKGVFTGDWELAWEGVKDIFKGIWNSILAIVGGVINAAIKGINWLIGKLNAISFTAPDWVPLVGGKTFSVNITPVSEWQVPYLASGAVIPPNREFMAVLGDQTSGTNIEAPLDTIVEAFQRVAGNQNVNITFTGDLAQLARVLNPVITKEGRRVGGSLVGV